MSLKQFGKKQAFFLSKGGSFQRGPTTFYRAGCELFSIIKPLFLGFGRLVNDYVCLMMTVTEEKMDTEHLRQSISWTITNNIAERSPFCEVIFRDPDIMQTKK